MDGAGTLPTPLRPSTGLQHLNPGQSPSPVAWPLTRSPALALQNITAPVGAEVISDSSKMDTPSPRLPVSRSPSSAAPAPGALAGNRLGWEPEPEPAPAPGPEPAKPQPRGPYPWEGTTGKEAYMTLLMRKEQLKDLDLANDPAGLDEWMALLGALDKEVGRYGNFDIILTSSLWSIGSVVWCGRRRW